MFWAKFGWTFWPFWPRNPKFSFAVPSNCPGIVSRETFAWTLPFPMLFLSLIHAFRGAHSELFNFPWQTLTSSNNRNNRKGGYRKLTFRARVSSATPCLVHALSVFPCIFYIKKGIWYLSKRAWIHIWYVSKSVPRCHSTPLMIILK